MPVFRIAFGADAIDVQLPEWTECLAMRDPEPLADPREAIAKALSRPIGSPPLHEIVRAKMRVVPNPTAAVVISDNTRPVPYSGESGILAPVVDALVAAGVGTDRITVIVATGTHRALARAELEAMIDPSVFARGIRIVCHDCRDESGLKLLGTTSRGTRVLMNRTYLESDIKILTGLVESHFMAGASGGRKSICPGLVGEKSTYVFHGPAFLSSPHARDLVLEQNPCHEEALEVAKMAGADFIVNVTLNSALEITGVYAGHFEAAHARAVERLSEYVSIPMDREYDIVVTHAGFVGINHYQAAKAAVVALPVLKPGGTLIMAANNVDQDPVGSPLYRTCLHLLTLHGPEAFMRLITSPDWTFIPEQWQVQMWAKVFAKIPMANFVYCAPHIRPEDAPFLPGKDGNLLLPPDRRYSRSLQDAARMVELAVADVVAAVAGAEASASASAWASAGPGARARDAQVRSGERPWDGRRGRPSIAFLKDGPYGVPVPARGTGKESRGAPGPGRDK